MAIITYLKNLLVQGAWGLANHHRFSVTVSRQGKALLLVRSSFTAGTELNFESNGFEFDGRFYHNDHVTNADLSGATEPVYDRIRDLISENPDAKVEDNFQDEQQSGRAWYSLNLYPDGDESWPALEQVNEKFCNLGRSTPSGLTSLSSPASELGT